MKNKLLYKVNKGIEQPPSINPYLKKRVRRKLYTAGEYVEGILKGDMSLIGPRPLRVHYLPLYNAMQQHRHDVRPGITGWTQVNGRNNISWGQKFELDVWYVNNLSLILDIKIILLTIRKVLKRSDISKQGYTTTTPFNGSN